MPDGWRDYFGKISGNSRLARSLHRPSSEAASGQVRSTAEWGTNVMGIESGKPEADIVEIGRTLHDHAGELAAIGRRIDDFDQKITAELRRRKRPADQP